MTLVTGSGFTTGLTVWANWSSGGPVQLGESFDIEFTFAGLGKVLDFEIALVDGLTRLQWTESHGQVFQIVGPGSVRTLRLIQTPEKLYAYAAGKVWRSRSTGTSLVTITGATNVLHQPSVRIGDVPVLEIVSFLNTRVIFFAPDDVAFGTNAIYINNVDTGQTYTKSLNADLIAFSTKDANLTVIGDDVLKRKTMA